MTIAQTKNWFHQLLLILLQVLSIGVIGISLWSSISHPQIQTRLDLRQTDLFLQAVELSPTLVDRVPLSAEDIYQQAKSAYVKVKQQSASNDSQLDLRLGILQAVTGEVAGAIDTWSKIQPVGSQPWLVGQILTSVWADAYLLPDAERQLQNSLDGWYRQQALAQLYRKQQRPERLQGLELESQVQARQAVQKLLLVNAVPVGGGFLGVVGWLIVGWRYWRKSNSDQKEARSWQVPWSSSETWGAMALWFASFVGISQILLPLGRQYFHIPIPEAKDYVGKALWVLVPYSLSVIPPLGLVLWSFRRYLPLSEPWFRWSGDRWWWWGGGGYLLAIPPVLVVSVISQLILGGKGGGNPLLPILVESGDWRAQLLLWITIGVCAPIAEELLFRGFLLPALTPNLGIGWSIGVSGFAFALVHLNLADVLPLTVLGWGLGYIYYRCQNLCASILCHSLWNTGSFLALLALGQ